ncbi:beta-N-acetylhexosaminidase [Thioalkalivibrio denitrificans]|uniref:Beta-hexosaminidase n=1 Tax=Thioalkalivibrio denitrificans TaxID=108003 RepID=A0A1V3NS88_9GAMM|nr:beta-N-acetylhexosaminidase [Thioalkalivibrio denitrificans]OOG27682.1 beta-N-acetylhexosaminidase [Thioalkalivibrio denitrificans]
MSLGPVMLDVEGICLTEAERRLLCHPRAGGVILFTRNFESLEQLTELVADIHALRTPRLLVAVDHEGGRVQRFREGFTRLPSAARLGTQYDAHHGRGRELARMAGWLMAAELRAAGVDFSFAPVLDLSHGISGVIGDRAFHRDPEVVADLAHHFMSGMQHAGMEAVGKHFPGHGGVREDSHLALPVDSRHLNELESDILPFERMIRYGLAGIMPAHVVYAQCDRHPAGFSPYWLNQILRRRLGFGGVIFSDDLSMAGAECMGDYPDRARAALRAGCDMVLVCNHPDAARRVMDALDEDPDPVSIARLARMHGRRSPGWEALRASEAWRRAHETLEGLHDSPLMELDV